MKLSDFYQRGSEVDPVAQWRDCLGVLTTALEISQISVAREAAVEAEILLLMGEFIFLNVLFLL